MRVVAYNRSFIPVRSVSFLSLICLSVVVSQSVSHPLERKSEKEKESADAEKILDSMSLARKK